MGREEPLWAVCSPCAAVDDAWLRGASLSVWQAKLLVWQQLDDVDEAADTPAKPKPEKAVTEEQLQQLTQFFPDQFIMPTEVAGLEGTQRACEQPASSTERARHGASRGGSGGAADGARWPSSPLIWR